MKMAERKRDSGLGRRGFTGIEIAIIGVFVLLSLVLSIAVPLFSLKIHIVRIVEIQYDYNNAGMTLLTLLSDEEVYEGLGIYVSGLNDNPDESFSRADVESALKSKLDKLVPNQCYELSYDGGVIAEGQSCNTDFSMDAYIVLPDSGKREKITLSISSATTKSTIPTPTLTTPTTAPLPPVPAPLI